MSLDRNSMDHHMKLAFLILSVLFTMLTGLLCSVLTGYRKRQKIYLESQQRQHQEMFAAFEEQRGWRRRRRRRQSENYDEEDDSEDYEADEDNDDYSAEALWHRLERIRKALKFEMLTLPAPPLEGGGEERIISQDVESANDNVDVRSKSLDSCQRHSKEEEDNDREKKVVSSSSPPPRDLKRIPSSSSPSDSDKIIVTSFFGLFMSPWWRKNDDENVCCICLEAYRENQIICSPKCPDCNHVFHEHCAIPWFQKHDECPMCRTNVLASFSVEEEDEHPKERSEESASSSAPTLV